MIVSYKDKKLKQLCTKDSVMRKKRPDIADRLKLRVNALETADSIEELRKNDPLGNWHRLAENRNGQWAGKLSVNERLIIQPTQDGLKVLDLELKLQVSEVMVVEIVDYHG